MPRPPSQLSKCATTKCWVFPKLVVRNAVERSLYTSRFGQQLAEYLFMGLTHPDRNSIHDVWSIGAVICLEDCDIVGIYFGVKQSLNQIDREAGYVLQIIFLGRTIRWVHVWLQHREWRSLRRNSIQSLWLNHTCIPA